jgi:hypothetical protein
MSDFPTLASGPAPSAAPPASDPGEFGPSIVPAAKPQAPAPEQRTFEQQRFAQDQAAADKNAKPPTADKAPPADPEQPAQPGADRVKVGKYETTEAELAAMMERQSIEDLRKATIPTAPEAYEAKLPADLKLPGGQEYRFDVNDPSLVAARNLAHAKGWSQQDFSDALGIFASHHAQQQAALAERSRQEIAKAGVNAPQRVDAVNKWLTATFGEADSAPLKATNVTDAHLRAWETVITKLTNQGGASFTQQHRVPPEANTIPGFDKMSFAQQRYAQDQLAARRGGR